MTATALSFAAFNAVLRIVAAKHRRYRIRIDRASEVSDNLSLFVRRLHTTGVEIWKNYLLYLKVRSNTVVLAQGTTVKTEMLLVYVRMLKSSTLTRMHVNGPKSKISLFLRLHISDRSDFQIMKYERAFESGQDILLN